MMPTGSAPPAMPMICTSPSIAAQAPAISTVGWAPTKSKTASAPSPPVSSRMRATASASECSAWCAPTSRASARFSSEMSSAITVAPLSARMSWMPTWPRPPAPMTTAVDPAPSFGSARLTAWYGVSPASVSETFCTGSRSPRGTRCRGLSTIMYSAIDPGLPSPGGWMPSSTARVQ